MIYRLFLASLCVVFFTGSADARQRAPACIETGTAMNPFCGMGRSVHSNNFLAGVRSITVIMKRERPVRARKGRHQATLGFWQLINSRKANMPSVSASIVSHPSGCPSRAFCGCGAAVEVFGSPVRSLWLAANWFKFPRTSPAAGMVAVRRHHVFVLRQHLGGNVWLAYDANSGRRQTRVHARSIAGYAIVNPHGAG